MENSQKYTPAAQAVIDKLRTTCTNHNNSVIMPSHLLLELCEPGTRSAELMEAVVGADRLADLRSELDVALYEPSASDGRDADFFNRTVTLIIKLAIIEARYMKSQLVDVEHLLLSLLHNKDVKSMSVIEPFISAGIDYESIARLLKAEMMPESDTPTAERPTADSGDENIKDENQDNPDKTKAGSQNKFRRSGRNDTPMLDKFGHDMTRAAQEGTLDPVVGREVEIERLAQILSRRKKQSCSDRRTGCRQIGNRRRSCTKNYSAQSFAHPLQQACHISRYGLYCGRHQIPRRI